MSIDLDIFRKAGVDNEKDARAQRAVKAFRSLQPTLTAYARILTKNIHIRVEMAARDNGSTDGKRIYFRPPIALGDATPHERRKCDKRDDKKQLLCLACATRESVLTTIYHEIAHICFDSFQKTSDKDKADLIAHAVSEVGGKYAEAIATKIKNTPSWHKDSYIGMAGLISEFLPIIVNALEDARVNSQLFKARKGTKVMFDADMHRVFTEGVEQKDAAGNIIIKPWNEYPLNLQAIVGVFTKASGYDYTDWFVEEVVTALNDEQLTELVKRIETVHSAADVYHLSFPVMARLRELGYCKLPEDPEVEGEEDGTEEKPSDEAGDQEGDSEPDDSAPPSDDASSEAEGSDDDEAESSGDGGEGGSEGEGTEGGSATGDPSEVEADAEAGGPAGDDQSDGSDGDSDSESSVGDGSEAEGPTDERGESSGEEGSTSEAADNPVDDGSQSDPDSAPSGGESESSREDQGRSNGEGDLSEDSEGSSEGDSGTDESDSGGGSSGSSEDDSSDDSTDSSDSSDTGEFVDSGDYSGSDGGEADLRPDDKEGHGDVDLADSDHSEDRETSGGDDVAPVRETSDGDEEDNDELIDTGADDGQGGTELIEHEKNDRLPMGDPEEVEIGLLKWGKHDEKPKTLEESDAEDAVDRAIVQGIYFETPSRYIYGVREHHYGQPVIINGSDMSNGWNRYLQKNLRSSGKAGDFTPEEKILGPALLRMRVAFSDNQRGKEVRGHKSGKVDARVLGRRAPNGDDRLFKKKTMPGKKDYFVVIGMDISGSTIGTNISLEKRSVMAQAQLLSRMGIPFAIFAHSGNYHSPDMGRSEGMDLDVYFIKEEHEVWDTKSKERLETIGPDSANLDGHACEFLRKRLDRSNASTKIMLYYSDGKMPAENHDEELEILQRELKLCKKKGYIVLGVGIRTDSPARHGLPTVQVDADEDIVKVVKFLEGAILTQ